MATIKHGTGSSGALPNVLPHAPSKKAYPIGGHVLTGNPKPCIKCGDWKQTNVWIPDGTSPQATVDLLNEAERKHQNCGSCR
jgi:hypothetical protein